MTIARSPDRSTHYQLKPMESPDKALTIGFDSDRQRLAQGSKGRARLMPLIQHASISSRSYPGKHHGLDCMGAIPSRMATVDGRRRVLKPLSSPAIAVDPILGHYGAQVALNICVVWRR
jgi:hypothetical protein